MVRIYCLDLQIGVLDRLGRDQSTGLVPLHLPLAAALDLLDKDLVDEVAFARVRTTFGHEGVDERLNKVTYLEPTPDGGLIQRFSDWQEGISVRITPLQDSEGRIRLSGAMVVRTIDKRAPLVGFEGLSLGRPMSHATQSLNPAVVLRPGEACVIGNPGVEPSGRERVLLISAEVTRP